jgi:deoxyribodipyrimidine photo-lyase
MKTALVWFTSDLRLTDNEVLVSALAKNEVVIPVYCLNADDFGTTKFGTQKTGAFRAKFILESLKDLDANLRLIGSGLVVVMGKPEVKLPELAKRYQAQCVFTKKQIAFDEIQTQLCVEKSLWKIGISMEVYSTSTLYHAVDLPFSIKDIPNVFTSFRKKVEKEASIRPHYHKPEKINSPQLPATFLPGLNDLGLTEKPFDTRSVLEFKGGETQALQRLNYYLNERQLILNYKDTRNGMVGGDYSSKLSPWLAQGCVSPREVYHQLKQFEEKIGANDSTYWLYFELLWRDYFRFMMKKYKQAYFFKTGIKGSGTEVGVHTPALFEKWKNGATGNDFVDANMTELNLTGFMSNRGRQNVASFFCNELNLDWRYGAAYFEEQLIDYDVSSNWLNWAYIAGVGNDPRDRTFNVNGQANRYDKNKNFRNLWLK